MSLDLPMAANLAAFSFFKKPRNNLQIQPILLMDGVVGLGIFEREEGWGHPRATSPEN